MYEEISCSFSLGNVGRRVRFHSITYSRLIYYVPALNTQVLHTKPDIIMIRFFLGKDVRPRPGKGRWCTGSIFLLLCKCLKNSWSCGTSKASIELGINSVFSLGFYCFFQRMLQKFSFLLSEENCSKLNEDRPTSRSLISNLQMSLYFAPEARIYVFQML